MPIVASISLFGLYLLINMVSKDIISGLLNLHITFICTYSIGGFMTEKFEEKKWFKDRVYSKLDYNINYYFGQYHLKHDITDFSIAGYGIAFFINSYYLYSGFWMCNNIIGIS